MRPRAPSAWLTDVIAPKVDPLQVLFGSEAGTLTEASVQAWIVAARRRG